MKEDDENQESEVKEIKLNQRGCMERQLQLIWLQSMRKLRLLGKASDARKTKVNSYLIFCLLGE